MRWGDKKEGGKGEMRVKRRRGKVEKGEKGGGVDR